PVQALRLLSGVDRSEDQRQARKLAGVLQMATKVAINGFGRIGRLVARAILERTDHDLDLVLINDLSDAKANALLFAYDSTHGRFPGTVTSDGDSIQVNGRDIAVTKERDPGKLPHKAMGIDL